MFLKLTYTKLDVFVSSKDFVLECYRVTRMLPEEEKFTMVQQIRKAALSVHFNIVQGCSTKLSEEKKRLLEISKDGLIKIDTTLDLAVALGYIPEEELKPFGEKLIKLFKLLSGLLGTTFSIL